MLSPQLLQLLREWWKAARPQVWLFPGQNPINPVTARQLSQFVLSNRNADWFRPFGIGKTKSAEPQQHRSTAALAVTDQEIGSVVECEIAGEKRRLQEILQYFRPLLEQLSDGVFRRAREQDGCSCGGLDPVRQRCPARREEARRDHPEDRRAKWMIGLFVRPISTLTNSRQKPKHAWIDDKSVAWLKKYRGGRYA
jgi:hypothetical protein